jgi:cyanophycin synthetase
MKIVEQKIICGPSYWSPEHQKLIVAKLEIHESDRPPDLIQRVQEVLPSLKGRIPGGLAADNLQAIVRLVAIELQRLAGMDCPMNAGEVSPLDDKDFIIYPYMIEKAGVYAGSAAVKIVKSLLRNRIYDVESEVDELKWLKRRYSMGPTAEYILDEIKRRKIPYRYFNNGSLITAGYGVKQKKLRTAVAETTSALGLEMAGDKEETKKILESAHIPIPKGILVYSEESLQTRISEVQFPLAIKPLDGNHGRGVTTNIHSLGDAMFAYNIASRISRSVIVEEYIPGDDYRFLVINYKLVAVTKRTPPVITGDGKSTIRQLIDEENKHPDRGKGADHVLALIEIEATTSKILEDRKLTEESVLKKGETLVLKNTANISSGGIATDVTDEVHPENKFLAEHIAKLFSLDICGIDIMATRVDVPITREIGAVIEVNAGPGLRMHSNPQVGKGRNVAAPIIDMLFPDAKNVFIPVIAIAGAENKSGLTQTLAKLAQEAGYRPGYNTTSGIFIEDHRVYEGDSANYVRSQDILFDPLVDYAILECSFNELTRTGLPFEHCDVCIVADLEGGSELHGISNKIELAMALASTLNKDGMLVLNADSEDVYSIAQRGSYKKALYSLHAENKRIKEHCLQNGLAAFVEENFVVLCNGGEKERVCRVTEKNKETLKDIIPAILAGFASGISTKQIVVAFGNNIPEYDLYW